MLLDDLTLDVLGKASFFGDCQSFRVVRLLHEVVNFDIVVHRVQADELSINALAFIILSDKVDTLRRSFLDLNIDNVAICGWVPIHSDLILEIIDRDLGCCRGGSLRTSNCLVYLLNFDNVIFEKVDSFFLSL